MSVQSVALADVLRSEIARIQVVAAYWRDEDPAYAASCDETLDDLREDLDIIEGRIADPFEGDDRSLRSILYQDHGIRCSPAGTGVSKALYDREGKLLGHYSAGEAERLIRRLRRKGTGAGSSLLSAPQQGTAS